jgi:hypothetical protein
MVRMRTMVRKRVPVQPAPELSGKLGCMRAVVRKCILVHASPERLWLIGVLRLIGCTMIPPIHH